MALPDDYTERVYAGILGKLIGVYLGRPFEGWTYERISQELGEIWYYVHERFNVPLIVTDDDISGTFTFVRALADYDAGSQSPNGNGGNGQDAAAHLPTAAQIGQTWLNYLIEERTILWWGGMGNSTEHTAYLRLKSGIPAPASGSMALNGKVVAEQIGAQIFIDAWAMAAPGDPALAVELARRAASVSHDGEAIYGAQMVAAMEAQAFVESDLDRLIDVGLSLIPGDSLIYRMVNDIRDWHAQHPDDWRRTRTRIAEHYGYDKYGGNCHMVPNHALIIFALLHGDDDFQKSLMIVNTAGWDTDCNSGNVGCLMGIKNGMAGIESGPDFRGPVADRMYLPTADGGSAITDAARETIRIANLGRMLTGEAPQKPKDGARFHFELPGSVQGFLPEADPGEQTANAHIELENVTGHSRAGTRSLAIRYAHVSAGCPARVATDTFIPSKEIADYFDRRGYSLLASPTLYSGQTVTARIEADGQNTGPVTCRLFLRVYQGPDDVRIRVPGPEAQLGPNQEQTFTWRIPDTGGNPIAQIGIEIMNTNGRTSSPTRADGVLYLDYLTWSGAPAVHFQRPAEDGTLWRRAWVKGVDIYGSRYAEAYRLIQNQGRGLLIQGTREWTDYRVTATVTPHMVQASGIAARVQGMRRYYALLLAPGSVDQDPSAHKASIVRLVKVLDGEEVLAEGTFDWRLGQPVQLSLQVEGDRLLGWVDGELLFQVTDQAPMLESGAVAFVCEEGRMASESMTVEPVVEV